MKRDRRVSSEVSDLLSETGRSKDFYLGGYCGNFAAGLREKLGYGSPIEIVDRDTGVSLHTVLDIGSGLVVDAGGVFREKDIVRKRGKLIKSVKEAHGLDPTTRIEVRDASWSDIRGTVGYVPLKEDYDTLVIEERVEEEDAG